MTVFHRLPALAALVIVAAIAACTGPQSSSSGASSAGSTTANPYPVPQGYVSGEHIVAYKGRISDKCENFTEPHRSYCVGGR